MPKRRTSNAAKKLKGTDTPSRMRDEPEFAVVSGQPDPPGWISENLSGAEATEARREWGVVVEELVETGVLRRIQLRMLAHYCKHHARCALGEPSAADLTQLRLLATEFGMTPASLSKAGSGSAGNKKNPFQEMTG